MPDLSKFTDVFISEAEECVQKLNVNLLSLEKLIKKGGDDATQKKILNELMRASHTIKGSSASMGYLKTAYMTHVMEDVFDNARNDILKMSDEIINIAFTLIDNLDKCINSIKENGIELDFSEQVERLKKMTGVNTVGVGKSAHGVETKPSQPASITETRPVEAMTPSAAPDQNKDADSANLASQLQDLSAVTKLDYIKVPIERLDELLDLVEELLIDKMKLEELSNKYSELKEVYAHMDLLISSIQYQVMQSRLVPVEQVFTRFPRMIRDLSQRLDKQIEFTIIGGDIELDRTIVDKLGEPLIHLLRNAADHGVEKQGYIKLEAYRKSNYVLISVENDGNSIDLNKIKQAAIRRGLITPQKAEQMDDEEIMDLIFDPQLSTKEEVTDISGRGVGLSVVRNFASMLSGNVVVENINPGVRFTLELPLTLAIINSLLVEVEDSIFAIPFSNIERSIVVTQDNIKKMADNEVAVVDGTKVPLARLNKIFNLQKYREIREEVMRRRHSGGIGISSKTEEKNDENINSKNDDLIVVLARKEKELIGIVVDNLISEEEIIVKPLSPVLRQVKGFSGSTILGDGRAVLILDVVNILNENN